MTIQELSNFTGPPAEPGGFMHGVMTSGKAGGLQECEPLKAVK